MIDDLSWQDFVAKPGIEAVETAIEGCGYQQFGARIQQGKLVVAGSIALPVVDNATSLTAFTDLVSEKSAAILAAPLQAKAALADTVIFSTIENYYHFMIYRFPALMFLRAFPAGARLTLAQVGGIPPSVLATVREVGIILAGDRRVDVAQLSDGAYDISNAMVTQSKNPWFAACFHRNITLPHLLEKARLAGVTFDSLPSRLFVRRASAVRRMINQRDIEAWYVGRGYVAVDPGTLPLPAQAAVFAHATHIVGIEGAALTNLVFATRTEKVTILSSPMLANDRFFADLVEPYGVPFKIVCGRVIAPGPFTRNSDFFMPIEFVAAAEN